MKNKDDDIIIKVAEEVDIRAKMAKEIMNSLKFFSYSKEQLQRIIDILNE